MNERLADEHPRRLRNTDRRYLIAELLMREPTRQWTPKQLADHLVADGFDLGEQPNKVVADTMRALMARDRARRVARGRYVLGRVPDTTGRRIRDRARRRRAALLPG